MSTLWSIVCVLTFIATGALTQGITGVLSKNIISPQTLKGDSYRSGLLQQGRQHSYINRAASVSTHTRNRGYLGAAHSDLPAGVSSIEKVGAVSEPATVNDKTDNVRPHQLLDKFSSCPEGFLGLGDVCYMLIPSKKTWGMSRNLCRAMFDGGDLAIIQYQEDYDFIRREFADTGSELVWIGMYKRSYPGPLKWVTGEKVTKLPFGPLDTEGLEGRVTMSLDKHQFLLDQNLESRHHFLCSTPRFPEEKEPTKSVSALKEADRASKKSSNLARKFTKNSTTSVSSVEEDEEISSARDPAADISSKSAPTVKQNLKHSTKSVPAALRSEKDTSGDTRSSNHTETGLTNKIPARTQKVRNSQMSDQGKWTESNERDAVKSKNAASEQKRKCERGWKTFEDYCYKSFYTKRTFPEASSSCQTKGAQLASVHSVEEHTFLSTEVMKQRPREAYWIGLTEYTDGLHWTDHSPVDYSVLEPRTNRFGIISGHDPVGPTARGCFAILTSKGVWSAIWCGAKLSYICRKEKHIGIPPQENNGHIPSNTGHADQVFAGKQRSISTKSGSSRLPPAGAVMGITVGLVAVLTVTTLGVITLYRRNGNSPFTWSRLQCERQPSEATNQSQENSNQYLIPNESENQTCDGYQPIIYGTL